MRRLIESGAVPGHRFVQIDLRGYWPPPETLAWMRGQRMRSYFMDDISERGLDTVVDEAVGYALAGEVAPHYDQPGDITAALANRVVLELTTGMAECRRRQGAPGASPSVT